MDKINLRTVSPETRKIIKKQVISLLKKYYEIADILGISKPAVDKIACAYKKEGTACLEISEKVSCFFEHKRLKYIQDYGY